MFDYIVMEDHLRPPKIDCEPGDILSEPDEDVELAELHPYSESPKLQFASKSTQTDYRESETQTDPWDMPDNVTKDSLLDSHIYKCHTCKLSFKRRGMLVNHLAKRHPDIRPETVPDLDLPILKTTRDYYCQYCEKVYKSSTKRKIHILKNHPGSALPLRTRIKGGVPEIPGLPNPTFSKTVGSSAEHPHHCSLCHKQYASRAKLLQHERKKHVDTPAPYVHVPSEYVANTTQVVPVCDQGTQLTGPIVIESLEPTLSQEQAAVLIDVPECKIHYVDEDSLVVSAHPDGLPTADLLTHVILEPTPNFPEYCANPDEFMTAQIIESAPVNPPSFVEEPTIFFLA